MTAWSSGVITGGSLVNGTTYAVAAAIIDADGNYTLGSGESTVVATSSGNVLLRMTIPEAPAVLIVWRKTGTGVLSAPDRYAIIPCAAREMRLHDTGGTISMMPWTTTGVPIPNSVLPGTNQTVSDFIMV